MKKFQNRQGEEVENRLEDERRGVSMEEARQYVDLLYANPDDEMVNLVYSNLNKDTEVNKYVIELFRKTDSCDSAKCKQIVESVISTRLYEAAITFEKFEYGRSRDEVEQAVRDLTQVHNIPESAFLPAAAAAEFIFDRIQYASDEALNENFIPELAERIHVSQDAIKRAILNYLVTTLDIGGEELIALAGQMAERLKLDQIETHEMVLDQIQKKLTFGDFQAALLIKKVFGLPDPLPVHEKLRTAALDGILLNIKTMHDREALHAFSARRRSGRPVPIGQILIRITTDDLTKFYPDLQNEVAQFGITEDDLERAVTYRQNFLRPHAIRNRGVPTE